MANAEHLKIVKLGVKVWNRWREENPNSTPDLSGAYLIGAQLSRANLSGADLRETDLFEADLFKANLSEADLGGADLAKAYLREADLFEANLSEANLSEAGLTKANLSEANLTKADLIEADLSEANLCNAGLTKANLIKANLTNAYLWEADLTGADLRGANLSGAFLGDTILGRLALEGTKGLDKCEHFGPSVIDYQTLQQSGMLPVEFLRGCGLPDSLIDFLPSLLKKDHYSCFISYSHHDKNFAQQLHNYLQEKGIRCWLDEHQILPGDDVRDQIDRGIKLWDKVLLCCSRSSLDSYWVNSEIDKALKKEETLWREQSKRTLALIPLNLDGYLFKWESSRKSILTDRHAENLVGWEKNPEKLEHALERIERALRADEGGREPPPESRL